MAQPATAENVALNALALAADQPRIITAKGKFLTNYNETGFWEVSPWPYQDVSKTLKEMYGFDLDTPKTYIFNRVVANWRFSRATMSMPPEAYMRDVYSHIGGIAPEIADVYRKAESSGVGRLFTFPMAYASVMDEWIVIRIILVKDMGFNETDEYLDAFANSLTKSSFASKSERRLVSAAGDISFIRANENNKKELRKMREADPVWLKDQNADLRHRREQDKDHIDVMDSAMKLKDTLLSSVGESNVLESIQFVTELDRVMGEKSPAALHNIAQTVDTLQSTYDTATGKLIELKNEADVRKELMMKRISDTMMEFGGKPEEGEESSAAAGGGDGKSEPYAKAALLVEVNKMQAKLDAIKESGVDTVDETTKRAAFTIIKSSISAAATSVGSGAGMLWKYKLKLLRKGVAIYSLAAMAGYPLPVGPLTNLIATIQSNCSGAGHLLTLIPGLGAILPTLCENVGTKAPKFAQHWGAWFGNAETDMRLRPSTGQIFGMYYCEGRGDIIEIAKGESIPDEAMSVDEVYVGNALMKVDIKPSDPDKTLESIQTAFVAEEEANDNRHAVTDKINGDIDTLVGELKKIKGVVDSMPVADIQKISREYQWLPALKERIEKHINASEAFLDSASDVFSTASTDPVYVDMDAVDKDMTVIALACTKGLFMSTEWLEAQSYKVIGQGGKGYGKGTENEITGDIASRYNISARRERRKTPGKYTEEVFLHNLKLVQLKRDLDHLKRRSIIDFRLLPYESEMQSSGIRGKPIIHINDTFIVDVMYKGTKNVVQTFKIDAISKHSIQVEANIGYFQYSNPGDFEKLFNTFYNSMMKYRYGSSKTGFCHPGCGFGKINWTEADLGKQFFTAYVSIVYTDPYVYRDEGYQPYLERNIVYIDMEVGTHPTMYYYSSRDIIETIKMNRHETEKVADIDTMYKQATDFMTLNKYLGSSGYKGSIVYIREDAFKSSWLSHEQSRADKDEASFIFFQFTDDRFKNYPMQVQANVSLDASGTINFDKKEEHTAMNIGVVNEMNKLILKDAHLYKDTPPYIRLCSLMRSSKNASSRDVEEGIQTAETTGFRTGNDFVHCMCWDDSSCGAHSKPYINKYSNGAGMEIMVHTFGIHIACDIRNCYAIDVLEHKHELKPTRVHSNKCVWSTVQPMSISQRYNFILANINGMPCKYIIVDNRNESDRTDATDITSVVAQYNELDLQESYKILSNGKSTVFLIPFARMSSWIGDTRVTQEVSGVNRTDFGLQAPFMSSSKFFYNSSVYEAGSAFDETDSVSVNIITLPNVTIETAWVLNGEDAIRKVETNTSEFYMDGETYEISLLRVNFLRGRNDGVVIKKPAVVTGENYVSWTVTFKASNFINVGIRSIDSSGDSMSIQTGYVISNDGNVESMITAKYIKDIYGHPLYNVGRMLMYTKADFDEDKTDTTCYQTGWTYDSVMKHYDTLAMRYISMRKWEGNDIITAYVTLSECGMNSMWKTEGHRGNIRNYLINMFKDGGLISDLLDHLISKNYFTIDEHEEVEELLQKPWFSIGNQVPHGGKHDLIPIFKPSGEFMIVDPKGENKAVGDGMTVVVDLNFNPPTTLFGAFIRRRPRATKLSFPRRLSIVETHGLEYEEHEFMYGIMSYFIVMHNVNDYYDTVIIPVLDSKSDITSFDITAESQPNIRMNCMVWDNILNTNTAMGSVIVPIVFDKETKCDRYVKMHDANHGMVPWCFPTGDQTVFFSRDTSIVCGVRMVGDTTYTCGNLSDLTSDTIGQLTCFSTVFDVTKQSIMKHFGKMEFKYINEPDLVKMFIEMHDTLYETASIFKYTVKPQSIVVPSVKGYKPFKILLPTFNERNIEKYTRDMSPANMNAHIQWNVFAGEEYKSIQSEMSAPIRYICDIQRTFFSERQCESVVLCKSPNGDICWRKEIHGHGVVMFVLYLYARNAEISDTPTVSVELFNKGDAAYTNSNINLIPEVTCDHISSWCVKIKLPFSDKYQMINVETGDVMHRLWKFNPVDEEDTAGWQCLTTGSVAKTTANYAVALGGWKDSLFYVYDKEHPYACVPLIKEYESPDIVKEGGVLTDFKTATKYNLMYDSSSKVLVNFPAISTAIMCTFDADGEISNLMTTGVPGIETIRIRDGKHVYTYTEESSVSPTTIVAMDTKPSVIDSVQCVQYVDKKFVKTSETINTVIDGKRCRFIEIDVNTDRFNEYVDVTLEDSLKTAHRTRGFPNTDFISLDSAEWELPKLFDNLGRRMTFKHGVDPNTCRWKIFVEDAKEFISGSFYVHDDGDKENMRLYNLSKFTHEDFGSDKSINLILTRPHQDLETGANKEDIFVKRDDLCALTLVVEMNEKENGTKYRFITIYRDKRMNKFNVIFRDIHDVKQADIIDFNKNYIKTPANVEALQRKLTGYDVETAHENAKFIENTYMRPYLNSDVLSGFVTVDGPSHDSDWDINRSHEVYYRDTCTVFNATDMSEILETAVDPISVATLCGDQPGSLFFNRSVDRYSCTTPVEREFVKCHIPSLGISVMEFTTKDTYKPFLYNTSSEESVLTCSIRRYDPINYLPPKLVKYASMYYTKMKTNGLNAHGISKCSIMYKDGEPLDNKWYSKVQAFDDEIREYANNNGITDTQRTAVTECFNTHKAIFQPISYMFSKLVKELNIQETSKFIQYTSPVSGCAFNSDKCVITKTICNEAVFNEDEMFMKATYVPYADKCKWGTAERSDISSGPKYLMVFNVDKVSSPEKIPVYLNFEHKLDGQEIRTSVDLEDHTISFQDRKSERVKSTGNSLVLLRSSVGKSVVYHDYNEITHEEIVRYLSANTDETITIPWVRDNVEIYRVNDDGSKTRFKNEGVNTPLFFTAVHGNSLEMEDESVSRDSIMDKQEKTLSTKMANRRYRRKILRRVVKFTVFMGLAAGVAWAVYNCDMQTIQKLLERLTDALNATKQYISETWVKVMSQHTTIVNGVGSPALANVTPASFAQPTSAASVYKAMETSNFSRVVFESKDQLTTAIATFARPTSEASPIAVISGATAMTYGQMFGTLSGFRKIFESIPGGLFKVAGIIWKASAETAVTAEGTGGILGPASGMDSIRLQNQVCRFIKFTGSSPIGETGLTVLKYTTTGIYMAGWGAILAKVLFGTLVAAVVGYVAVTALRKALSWYMTSRTAVKLERATSASSASISRLAAQSRISYDVMESMCSEVTDAYNAVVESGDTVMMEVFDALLTYHFISSSARQQEDVVEYSMEQPVRKDDFTNAMKRDAMQRVDNPFCPIIHVQKDIVNIVFIRTDDVGIKNNTFYIKTDEIITDAKITAKMEGLEIIETGEKRVTFRSIQPKNIVLHKEGYGNDQDITDYCLSSETRSIRFWKYNTKGGTRFFGYGIDKTSEGENNYHCGLFTIAAGLDSIAVVKPVKNAYVTFTTPFSGTGNIHDSDVLFDLIMTDQKQLILKDGTLCEHVAFAVRTANGMEGRKLCICPNKGSDTCDECARNGLKSNPRLKHMGNGETLELPDTKDSDSVSAPAPAVSSPAAASPPASPAATPAVSSPPAAASPQPAAVSSPPAAASPQPAAVSPTSPPAASPPPQPAVVTQPAATPPQPAAASPPPQPAAASPPPQPAAASPPPQAAPASPPPQPAAVPAPAPAPVVAVSMIKKILHGGDKRFGTGTKIFSMGARSSSDLPFKKDNTGLSDPRLKWFERTYAGLSVWMGLAGKYDDKFAVDDGLLKFEVSNVDKSKRDYVDSTVSMAGVHTGGEVRWVGQTLSEDTDTNKYGVKQIKMPKTKDKFKFNVTWCTVYIGELGAQKKALGVNHDDRYKNGIQFPVIEGFSDHVGKQRTDIIIWHNGLQLASLKMRQLATMHVDLKGKIPDLAAISTIVDTEGGKTVKRICFDEKGIKMVRCPKHGPSRYELTMLDCRDEQNLKTIADDTQFFKIIDTKSGTKDTNTCNDRCEENLTASYIEVAKAYCRGLECAKYVIEQGRIPDDYQSRGSDASNKKLRDFQSLVRSSMFEHVADVDAEWDGDVEHASASASASAEPVMEVEADSDEGDLYDGRFLMSAKELRGFSPGRLVLEGETGHAGTGADATPLGDWVDEDFDSMF